MRKLWLVVFAALFVVATILPATAMSEGKPVNPNEATIVAEKFLTSISTTENFKEWKDVHIEEKTACFNVENDKTAYIFELVKEGEYKGYMVVSAKKTNYPILEYSKGDSPLMSNTSVKSDKVYRLGPLGYLFKKDYSYYLNGEKVNFSKVKKGVKELKERNSVQEHLAKRAKEAKSQWEKYNSTTTSEFTTLSSWYGNHIYGVEGLHWDDGCTPTAAAMVLEYWGEEGYSNLNYDDSWYSETTDLCCTGDNCYDDPVDEHTDLTEKLHQAMATWSSCYTPVENVATGINYVCNQHGYGDWATWLDDGTYDWSWNVNEINSGYPYVFTMWWYTQDPHSIAVAGYRENIDTGEKQLIIYDTHNDEEGDYDEIKYVAFNSWGWSDEYKVHP